MEAGGRREGKLVEAGGRRKGGWLKRVCGERRLVEAGGRGRVDNN